VNITKYPTGRESYDFTISRSNLLKLLISVAENNNSYEYWLPTKSKELVKLIIKEDK
jgi:hypothetical protein